MTDTDMNVSHSLLLHSVRSLDRLACLNTVLPSFQQMTDVEFKLRALAVLLSENAATVYGPYKRVLYLVQWTFQLQTRHANN